MSDTRTAKPFRTDPDKSCPSCPFGLLRTPLAFNATDPATGEYWCVDCDGKGTGRRLIAHFKSQLPKEETS